jgi:myo-inositol-1(or 4)-monophosphatase
MAKMTNTLDIAIEIARAAGAILRQGWGRAGQIEYKGEVNLVTEYDRRAEALIVAALRKQFPTHHIYAEEQGDVGPGDSPYTWLIDPLDGTTNFAHGFPAFAVSIGLMHQGERIVGIIFDPTRDELFTAGVGLGARLNGVPIHVSDTASLDRALLATGFAYDRRTAANNNVNNLARFIRHCQGIRRAGSAALDLAYVACGRLDGFWEMGLHPWDVAAGTLIIHQAGGRVTDFDGRDDDHPSGQRVVASNGLIHQEMLDILRIE